MRNFALCLVTILVGVFAVDAAAIPPQVGSVLPTRHRIDAPPSSVIQVQFSQNIDASTVDAISFRV